MTNVYIAAAYSGRDVIRQDYIPRLEAAGHHVTSSWLNDTAELTPGTVGAALDRSEEYLRRHVMNDIREVRESDALLLFTENYMRALGFPGPYNTGGRHVETGVALASGVQVIVIGQPENVFHRVGVILCNGFVAAVDALGTSQQ